MAHVLPFALRLDASVSSQPGGWVQLLLLAAVLATAAGAYRTRATAVHWHAATALLFVLNVLTGPMANLYAWTRLGVALGALATGLVLFGLSARVLDQLLDSSSIVPPSAAAQTGRPARDADGGAPPADEAGPRP